MTTADIRALVIGAAPNAKRYTSSFDGESFTVWGEYERLKQAADDRHNMGWRFEIAHYTRDEDDATAAAIEEALIAHPGVAYRYTVGYDHAHGYIRHIFDCEGV